MSQRIIAGEDVYKAYASARALAVLNTTSMYGSEALPRFQMQSSIIGCKLVESMYGWSVRYNSGLQNFELIASSKCKQVNGTFEDAERFAKEWVAQDPTRRYAEVWE